MLWATFHLHLFFLNLGLETSDLGLDLAVCVNIPTTTSSTEVNRIIANRKAITVNGSLRMVVCGLLLTNSDKLRH